MVIRDPLIGQCAQCGGSLLMGHRCPGTEPSLSEESLLEMSEMIRVANEKRKNRLNEYESSG